MIIIEGPDGAGKSHLVNRIHYMFETYVEIGQRNPDRSQLWRTGATDVYRAIAADIAEPERCFVWDRLFYSELVYPEFMRRPSCFNAISQAYVSRLLDMTGAVIVFCLPPRDICIENTGLTHQHERVTGNAGAIWDSYYHLYLNVNQYRPVAVLWDYVNMGSLTQISGKVLEHLKYRKGLVPHESR